jgi:histidinol-phosphatase (PHP family)
VAVIVDYHMHLREPGNSGEEGAVANSVEAIERYVEEAGRKGVAEIGFAEHLYYFRQFAPLVEHPYQRARNEHDLDDYCDAVLEAKRQGLPVKLGLEVEYYAGRERELADLLAPYPWDYLLGAVHVLDGEMVDVAPGLWGRLPVEEVWRRYFVGLRSLARSGLVDVLAHPDLVKIFGERPSADAVSLHYEETADAIEAAGVAIEVSTAGLRKPVAEVYPDPEFLTACRSRGIAATTASDAHGADDVGRDFEHAVELLREAGYETVTVFDARRSRQVPLA